MFRMFFFVCAHFPCPHPKMYCVRFGYTSFHRYRLFTNTLVGHNGHIESRAKEKPEREVIYGTGHSTCDAIFAMKSASHLVRGSRQERAKSFSVARALYIHSPQLCGIRQSSASSARKVGCLTLSTSPVGRTCARFFHSQRPGRERCSSI